jgi:hypothetical protein
MSLCPECQSTHDVDPHRSESYSGSWNTFSLGRDIDFCAQSCVQSLLWRITYNQSSLQGLTGPRDFSLKNTVCSSSLSLTSLKLSVGNWNLSIKRADKCLLACTFGSWLKHDTELAHTGRRLMKVTDPYWWPGLFWFRSIRLGLYDHNCTIIVQIVSIFIFALAVSCCIISYSLTQGAAFRCPPSQNIGPLKTL